MSNLTTLDALEEKVRSVDAEFLEDPDDDEDDEEAILHNDLMAANQLLKRAATLMDFVSDKVMCPAVSKRERNALARLSDEIHTFNSEVDGYYTEDE